MARLHSIIFWLVTVSLARAGLFPRKVGYFSRGVTSDHRTFALPVALAVLAWALAFYVSDSAPLFAQENCGGMTAEALEKHLGRKSSYWAELFQGAELLAPQVTLAYLVLENSESGLPESVVPLFVGLCVCFVIWDILACWLRQSPEAQSFYRCPNHLWHSLASLETEPCPLLSPPMVEALKKTAQGLKAAEAITGSTVRQASLLSPELFESLCALCSEDSALLGLFTSPGLASLSLLFLGLGFTLVGLLLLLAPLLVLLFLLRRGWKQRF